MNLWDILFPKLCMGCGRFGGYICSDCLAKISVRDNQKCPMCEKMAVSGLTHTRCKTALGMEGLLIGFLYTGLLRKMITKYKLSFVSEVLPDLVELWVSLADWEAVASKGTWLITAVPLHASRLRFRGYNQAELLAKSLADYFGFEYIEVLQRTTHTTPQSELKRNKRQDNIRGIFKIVDPALVAGKQVLLVDDIWTTGSTMRECATVLKRAKANMVWGAALAG